MILSKALGWTVLPAIAALLHIITNGLRPFQHLWSN